MPRESDQALAERIRTQVIPVVSDNWHIPQLSWKPVYCWDLDSTIASTVQRRHMVEEIRADAALAGEGAWDRYAMACADDAPITGSVALMRELRGPHVVISGRSGCAAQLTQAWFEYHDVPVHATLLRAEGDHTRNGLYKVRVIEALRKAGVTVSLFFEDWKEAAEEIAARTGVPVVGINPFDPAEFPARQGAI